MSSRNIYYGAYSMDDFKRACGMFPRNELTPIFERHYLIRELVFAKYRNGLRKDIKKAIAQLKRKAKKAPIKPKVKKKSVKRNTVKCRATTKTRLSKSSKRTG